MKRPLIGVTGPDRAGLAAWWFSAWGVWRAGGRPLRITPKRAYQGPLDGLIIGGGADVSPDLYEPESTPVDFEEAGRDFREKTAAVFVGLIRRLLSRRGAPSRTDEARDVLETAWVSRAVREGIPLLGICRGMQLVNVVCGGNLIQDIRPLYTEHAYVRSVFPRKTVRIAEGSLLSDALGTQRCRVNALHRQAVGRLGERLNAVGWDASGVIQAIERREGALLLGIQWHPELLPQLESQRRLFRELVASARHHATKRREAMDTSEESAAVRTSVIDAAKPR